MIYSVTSLFYSYEMLRKKSSIINGIRSIHQLLQFPVTLYLFRYGNRLSSDSVDINDYHHQTVLHELCLSITMLNYSLQTFTQVNIKSHSQQRKSSDASHNMQYFILQFKTVLPCLNWYEVCRQVFPIPPLRLIAHSKANLAWIAKAITAGRSTIRLSAFPK